MDLDLSGKVRPAERGSARRLTRPATSVQRRISRERTSSGGHRGRTPNAFREGNWVPARGTPRARPAS